MAARVEENYDEHVDFGVFDHDDNDIPALLDAVIDLDLDDESINSLPAMRPCIVDLDEEDGIDRIDNLLAEDEDGLMGVDDHIIDGNLEALDEHAADDVGVDHCQRPCSRKVHHRVRTSWTAWF
jgi:hypothetical protein